MVCFLESSLYIPPISIWGFPFFHMVNTDFCVLDIVVWLWSFCFQSCPFCVHGCVDTYMCATHVVKHVCRGMWVEVRRLLVRIQAWHSGHAGLAAEMLYPLSQVSSLLQAFPTSVSILQFWFTIPLETVLRGKKKEYINHAYSLPLSGSMMG